MVTRSDLWPMTVEALLAMGTHCGWDDSCSGNASRGPKAHDEVRLQRKLNVAQVIDLPDELATLAGPACIIWNVNERAAFVVKLDRQTIDGFRGALPIGLRAECGFYPDSAVIRLVLSFHDQQVSVRV